MNAPERILFIGEGSKLAGAETYMINLLRSLPAAGNMKLFVALCYDGPVREKIGSAAQVIDLCGRDNYASILRIVDFVKKNGIQIIHLIDVKGTVLGAIASMFLRDVKVVVTLHGLPEYPLPLSRRIKHACALLIYFLFMRFAADCVICVSRDLQRRFRRRIGAGKIRTIHNGLATGADKPHAKRNRNGSRLVGAIGRLDEVKGHRFLIVAAASVLQKVRNTAFHVAGTGPLLACLQAQANEQGIGDKIVFRGFDRQPRLFLEEIDIFVLPSLHEGIPYALLEAMYCSKPVVCSNVGGIPEIVEHGKDGILVPPKDPAALSTALLRLIDDPEYSAYLGRNARRKIEERFTSSLMGNRTYELYCRLFR
jgi:glycosyltransferase involved in cell wall biosynthesis